MKPLSKTIVFSVLPLLTPLAAIAEPSAKPDASPVENNLTNKAIGSSWRASEIIGTDVKNAADEKVGKVDDLAVDFQSGKILAVIISTGGFLNIADTLSAVPPSTLRYDAEAKVFRTSLTKEQLTKAPQFKADQWKDQSDTTLIDKVRVYRDSIGGDITAADNSAQNERDADGKTTTPGDQGNSDADLKVTKDIRAAIVAADVSFNAKNIKIITLNGTTTLRGVVASADEHATVLKIAKANAGSATVVDKLEVK